MPKIAEQLKEMGLKQPRKGPLWTGPCGGGPQGGITQTLVGRWLADRERFRLMVIDGWKPADQFHARLHYGQMWHAAEEGLAKCKPNDPERVQYAIDNMAVCAKDLCKKYPLQQQEVEHWFATAATEFPYYVTRWEKHPDTINRIPLLQEQVFDVPYTLASGRVVRLRGRWDSVDLVKDKDGSALWLMENKTKSDIVEQQITRQLLLDLQTMFYMEALCDYQHSRCEDNPNDEMAHPIKGVRYNVVRRPLSGGKYTITRHKATKGAKCPKCKGSGDHLLGGGMSSVPYPRCPKCGGLGRVGAKPEESADHFYGRLGESIKSDPSHFFMRLNVTITPTDLANFKRKVLEPVLENICDDYEWWAFCSTHKNHDPFNYSYRAKLFPKHQNRHFLTPFGIWNPLLEGKPTDLDSFILEGNTTGLRKVEDLFPELK